MFTRWFPIFVPKQMQKKSQSPRVCPIKFRKSKQKILRPFTRTWSLRSLEDPALVPPASGSVPCLKNWEHLGGIFFTEEFFSVKTSKSFGLKLNNKVSKNPKGIPKLSKTGFKLLNKRNMWIFPSQPLQYLPTWCRAPGSCSGFGRLHAVWQTLSHLPMEKKKTVRFFGLRWAHVFLCLLKVVGCLGVIFFNRLKTLFKDKGRAALISALDHPKKSTRFSKNAKRFQPISTNLKSWDHAW